MEALFHRTMLIDQNKSPHPKYFLEHIFSSPKQQKWVTKMLCYDYEIIGKKEKDNVMEDALSRKHKQEGPLFALSSPAPE